MSGSPAHEAITRAGGVGPLAEKVGVTYQAVKKWEVSGRIPTERVPAVSEATGIPRHELRPDLPEIFPPPEHIDGATTHAA